MIGFPEARVNFAMLNEIPMRLREHAERQQQIAEAAADEESPSWRRRPSTRPAADRRASCSRRPRRGSPTIDAEMVAAEDQVGTSGPVRNASWRRGAIRPSPRR
jgi:hypothetical protein